MIRRTRSSAIAVLIVLAALAASTLRVAPAGAGQARRSAAIQVTEATGIRRTEYPVNARVQLPKGALADAAHARLRQSDADAPAQYSAESRWDDGSVQWLDVDFNVS